MRKTFFHSLPMIMAAMMMVACSNEDATALTGDNTQQSRTWQVSINAGPATTRAISVGGNNGQTLYTNWDANDAVEVVKDVASVGTLNADVSAGNSAYATLKGTLEGTFSVGDNVTLCYHTAALDYTGQVGTLAGVSTNKSYLTATSTVKSVDGSGGFLSMSDAAFTAEQAYLDLSFTKGDNPISITRLDIWADGGKLVKTKAIDGTTTYATEAEPLTITPASATDRLFIALRDENNAANNYHFKATEENNVIYTYEGSKNLLLGKFYKGTVTMAAISHALSAAVVGEVVGTNGLAYDVAYKDNLPTGVSAAGMVAYKSGSSCLVIALADESSAMDWDTANGTNGAAAHMPTVTGQTWKVPSRAEWELMFSANGGNAESYAGLNTAITNAGGTALQGDNGYWSSTEHTPGSGAYIVTLSGGSASWASGKESDLDERVRACFAFGVVAATGHALSESVVGEVVGTDGLAYALADKDNLPVTAAGMVAYKNGSSGLVIALYDDGEMNWNTANGTSGAAAHKITVTGQTWRLPSQVEWNNMFEANGGNAGSYTGLNTAITAAGGTALQGDDKNYWSSTEYDAGNAAYLVNLSGGSTNWPNSNESNVWRVRACLAF